MRHSARSAALATGEGCRQSEPDVDTTGQVALMAGDGPVLAQPASSSASQQGVGRVGADAEQHEDAPEQEHLVARAAVRGVYELRQEGQEEERRFRVEQR